jgi:excisionase family DNA binding protein
MGITMAKAERWYSLQEIAEHLGVSQDTVHRWIRLKAMPAHKVGRLWKFKVSQIDKWIKSGKARHD